MWAYHTSHLSIASEKNFVMKSCTPVFFNQLFKQMQSLQAKNKLSLNPTLSSLRNKRLCLDMPTLSTCSDPITHRLFPPLAFE